ncbi:MAG: MqnA/MqnD/SBP family protein [Verrucomicrobiia bacterium]
MKLTLGHSPDPDDAFMFYALAEHKIDTGQFQFEHILQDIQTLNERATRQELDITAVSIHAYAYLTEHYALLSSGASMGDNYGPILVGKKYHTKKDFKKMRIAVPGTMTSAYLALQLYLDGKGGEAFSFITVPFDQIFDALHRNEAEVGLLIHEGQLTYQKEGFVLCEDLGKWWFQETNGLPLPLGGNAIKRSLGKTHMQSISALLKNSIHYGLSHREAGVQHALPLGRGLNTQDADHFIGMYVNELTLDYGERGKAAIKTFLNRSAQKGFIPMSEK